MALLLVTYVGCKHYTLTWAHQIHSRVLSTCINVFGPYNNQSHTESHKLAFTYDLLVLAQPLHQLPAQQVFWAALTIAHFGQVNSWQIRNALTQHDTCASRT